MTVNVAIFNAKNNIVKAVNESGLPLSIISLIFKDILSEIDSKAQEELKQDLQRMQEEELSKQKNKKNLKLIQIARRNNYELNWISFIQPSKLATIAK